MRSFEEGGYNHSYQWAAGNFHSFCWLIISLVIATAGQRRYHHSSAHRRRYPRIQCCHNFQKKRGATVPPHHSHVISPNFVRLAQGTEEEVTLRRMSSDLIADRRRLFEVRLRTQRNHAPGLGDDICKRRFRRRRRRRRRRARSSSRRPRTARRGWATPASRP